ncbi:hypothetical protein JVT61DRAFT_11754 [Boletus reticuloceps]|uniref:Secreted protein n=1 Tax=Boletus reticuloceps TaxID=495285 RepID=A0A8I2YU14_9AGAM|nr:hypothetical protein JVT61DRAFT_11754 [Boletus reticuloceps]
MFARVLALLPLALLASASHLEARTACNSGSVNCCNSVQTDSSIQPSRTVQLRQQMGVSAMQLGRGGRRHTSVRDVDKLVIPMREGISSCCIRIQQRRALVELARNQRGRWYVLNRGGNDR